MKKHLRVESGTVLDIGAHWGYFCSRFEELGFTCFAVESSALNLYFLKKLKRAQNRSFVVIDKPIFNYMPEIKFDIVLAQYIFHHFLKEKASFLALKNLLHRLRMEAMFLGCHQYDQKAMMNSYINFKPEEMVEFIVNNSCLEKSIYIGEEAGYRKQFLLYK
jgi:hypothetical protein